MYYSRKLTGLIFGATLALIAAASPCLAQHSSRGDNEHYRYCGRSWGLDRFDLDIDGDIVVISCPHCRDDHSIVEITGTYELRIDDEAVAVDKDQRELLKTFHTDALELEEQAHRIARDGARIGIKGAKLGLSAVGKVFKLLSPEYDADDLEREMDSEAAKLEREADALDKRAKKIEDLADDLEDQARELKRAIPELRAVHWF